MSNDESEIISTYHNLPEILEDMKHIIQKGDVNDLTPRLVMKELSSKFVELHDVENKPQIRDVLIEKMTAYVENWKTQLKEEAIGVCSVCKKKDAGTKMSGVVVGYGSAGSSRVKDLQSNPHFELKGVVSRRTLSNVTQVAFDDILKDDSINAIFICSENDLHYQQALEALSHKKNVVVEYPLCYSLKEAEHLFSLADKNGTVLRVEHIGLLSISHLKLKERIDKLTAKLKEGRVQFCGGISRLITMPTIKQTDNGEQLVFDKSGHPAFSGIMRLIKLIDLFGKLTLVSSTISLVHEDTTLLPIPNSPLKKDLEAVAGYRMEAVLATTDGAQLHWSEERIKGGKRSTGFRFEFEDGAIIDEDPPGYQPYSLFSMDGSLFAHEVIDRSHNKEEREKTLHSIEIAEQISLRSVLKY